MSVDRRHISFNEKFPHVQHRSISLNHPWIRASHEIILTRYLSFFEERFPTYLNHQWRSNRFSIEKEKFRIDQLRLQHKDAIELIHLQRVRNAFECAHSQIDRLEKETFVLIIDAFQVYLEHFLRSKATNKFLQQFQLERKENSFQVSIDLHCVDVINEILLSLNRICRSTLTRLKPIETAQILTLLFPSLIGSCPENLFPLILANYHRFQRPTNDSLSRKISNPIATVFDRYYYGILNLLMTTMEKTPDAFPYNEDPIDPRPNEPLLFDRTTLNLKDCSDSIRLFLKRIFTDSAVSMISVIDDQNDFIDFHIDSTYFDVVMRFLQHLHQMNQRDRMIEYFSTVLFARSSEKPISTKMKSLFRLLIEHFNQIKSNDGESNKDAPRNI